MTDRAVGNSHLETVLLGLFFVAIVGLGLVWVAGVLVAAILKASLRGDFATGLASLAEEFPNVGRAWRPPIPSLAVWLAAAAIGGVLVPLGRKMSRAGRLKEGGARWATVRDLRRAGLLIRDSSKPHAVDGAEVADESE